MSAKPPSQLRQAWLRWKALRLPWRKRFLVGLDLQGNTFWEFKDTLNAGSNRMRRIVQYPTSVHLSEINISPQWHQWLRHTRQHPPTLTEQSQDLVRQRNLKILAAEADARWAAKPSFLDAPVNGTQLKDPGEYAHTTAPAEKEGVRNAVGSELEDNTPGTNKKTGQASKKQEKPVAVESTSSTQTTKRNSGADIKEKKARDDPWKQARGGPSEEWQPQAWDPNALSPKR